MEALLTLSNIVLLSIVVVLFILLFKKGIIKDFLLSFKNNEEGYSSRKLTAFGFSGLTVAIELLGVFKELITGANIVTVILIDIAVILLSLALLRFEDILKFKNGTTVVESKSTVEAKTTTNE